MTKEQLFREYRPMRVPDGYSACDNCAFREYKDVDANCCNLEVSAEHTLPCCVFIVAGRASATIYLERIAHHVSLSQIE